MESPAVTAHSVFLAREVIGVDIHNIPAAQQPMYAEIVELKLGDGSIRRGQVHFTVVPITRI